MKQCMRHTEANMGNETDKEMRDDRHSKKKYGFTDGQLIHDK